MLTFHNLFALSMNLSGGRYHIETSPLICKANQWTGFYMITTSVMKELNNTDYLFISLVLQNYPFALHYTCLCFKLATSEEEREALQI